MSRVRQRIKLDENGNEIKRPTRYYSTKQESTVAELLHGKRTKNSGATMFDPGDVKTNNFLIECKTKTTDSKSITIHKEWLEKVKSEAILANKQYTALIFNFGPDTPNYAIIDINTFKLFVEFISLMKDSDDIT